MALNELLGPVVTGAEGRTGLRRCQLLLRVDLVQVAARLVGRLGWDRRVRSGWVICRVWLNLHAIITPAADGGATVGRHAAQSVRDDCDNLLGTETPGMGNVWG